MAQRLMLSIVENGTRFFCCPPCNRQETILITPLKLPEKSLKPKYFGENANRASRDWSDKNHRSGAHVSQAGHRMLNQDRNDKRRNRRNRRNRNRRNSQNNPESQNSQKPEKFETPRPSEPNFTDLELSVIKNMRLSAKNRPKKNQPKKNRRRKVSSSSSSSSDSSEYEEVSASSSSSSSSSDSN